MQMWILLKQMQRKQCETEQREMSFFFIISKCVMTQQNCKWSYFIIYVKNGLKTPLGTP